MYTTSYLEHRLYSDQLYCFLYSSLCSSPSSIPCALFTDFFYFSFSIYDTPISTPIPFILPPDQVFRWALLCSFYQTVSHHTLSVSWLFLFSWWHLLLLLNQPSYGTIYHHCSNTSIIDLSSCSYGVPSTRYDRGRFTKLHRPQSAICCHWNLTSSTSFSSHFSVIASHHEIGGLATLFHNHVTYLVRSCHHTIHWCRSMCKAWIWNQCMILRSDKDYSNTDILFFDKWKGI